jgi:D-proline reductase (dithiol) PrdB
VTKVYDVPYMERTRQYYRAQGYTSDYQWAHFDDTPFQALTKPLSESRLGLVTTAMPDTEIGRKTRAVYSTAIAPLPESLYTAELSWHHGVTHTNDVASILPIEQLQALKAKGLIADIAREFHSAPTDYSKRNTLEKDAPEILRRCIQQNVDIALLVPL